MTIAELTGRWICETGGNWRVRLAVVVLGASALGVMLALAIVAVSA